MIRLVDDGGGVSSLGKGQKEPIGRCPPEEDISVNQGNLLYLFFS